MDEEGRRGSRAGEPRFEVQLGRNVLSSLLRAEVRSRLKRTHDGQVSTHDRYGNFDCWCHSKWVLRESLGRMTKMNFNATYYNGCYILKMKNQEEEWEEGRELDT